MFFMISTMSLVLAFVGGLAGLGIGYVLRIKIAKGNATNVEAIAEKKLTEAKTQEQQIILEAKEKAIKVIDEAKKEEEERRQELRKMQQRLESREETFDKKLLEIEDKKTELQEKVEKVKTIEAEVLAKKEEVVEKLATVATYTKDQAKEELLTKIEETAQDDLLNRVRKMENVGAEELEAKAQDIMVCCMQRTASSHASETTASAVNLPSDEMKGRIIGKEGRNIKTIERMTGCEIIIDETPEMLVISSFSPIRRRVCQLAIEKLIKDGRIQPAKIEEYIEEAKRDLAIDLKKSGEAALQEMGVIASDPKLASIVGRLKYRTSYGQNVLNHSLEVGHIAGLIAAEVGMDPSHARKAGFFHDIGKAIDHDTEGAHTDIGRQIMEKFNMHADFAEVCNTHHDTNPPLLLTKLVMAADAISASRTGARRDTYEQYVSRLKELEETAMSFPGIEKVYAIQAGREVRVFVTPEEIDDYAAYNLAKDIARKIESELQYPGEIKVNVIRETRVIEYAR
ncbi:MAG: Ribonuclease Y [Candidatus Magasanikbacteria bacterium GW2011_GWD2_43_18]|nr:MAG: Ribonuclease Y [Candidatus Magasanikbacteria bacterium GW2011_GWC2_42_27]KKT05276.1 MAG: Ribonuclease Y [Candidatus Magasanikbacteria bacterium GW2011_GWD2_43_18]KKT26102.1 MAG: Ribonuclease Y [Candidatus Magasanikbacteria bacterium GW2011_GWA2_43_9]HBB37612.1 ribonuclease Y [Candidatus Magasanikbacteria bacterium]HCC13540.1 ribonuclease Y [Candidatus Magasanikbacteria bacterium]